ncbi:DUF2162 family putative transporter [Thermodesulforhabdus norvegica]|uniref:Predicted transporter n=1 Tax=Thermodesulforhabdus norvegica TaxID=39841 RepID=A0A1I4QXB3_9BACT|nr:DUF2162 family putative transporter [Thermodesulforhabdus norvegica]SFM44651.1 Predicted transporter [Thermodesulforhabdus norvegica]
MSVRALIVGLFLALAVFAAKTGAGLAYGLKTRKSRRAVAGLLIGYSLGYLALISAMTSILTGPCLSDQVRAVLNNLAHHGITAHVCLALGLFVWGLILLGRPSREVASAGKAWLALVIPCPVCLLAISCSLAVLLVYLQTSGWKVILLAWALFIGTGLITAGLFSALKAHPDLILGFSMMGVAAYTLGSLFLGPSLEDARRVFRIVSTGRELSAFTLGKTLPVLIAAGLAFFGGFIRAFSAVRQGLPVQKSRKGVGL